MHEMRGAADATEQRGQYEQHPLFPLFLLGMTVKGGMKGKQAS
jgi:hypothetical protein